MNTNIYTLRVGDWSADGHGHFDTFHARIHDAFTVEQMRSAYDATVKQTGIDPAEFFYEYEQGFIDDVTARILVDTLGLKREMIEGWAEPGEDLEDFPIRTFVSTEAYATVLMLYIQRNLPGFVWEFIDFQEDGILFGGYDHRWMNGEIPDKEIAQIRPSVGYGLFY